MNNFAGIERTAAKLDALIAAKAATTSTNRINIEMRGFAVEQLKPTATPDPVPFEVQAEPTPWPSDCLPEGMAQAVAAIAEEVQAPPCLWQLLPSLAPYRT